MRLIIIIFFSILSLGAQEFKIEGQIKSYDENLPYANIIIRNIKKGAISDSNGKYSLDGIPSGLYLLEVSYSGYNIEKKKIELINDTIINFNLTKTNDLDEIVITGTRTFKRQTNSPVIVNILTNESLDKIQACSLSDGLKFQPGLRVETDCQTCNYTQLRMNGLAGGYSQIVVNGRPVISPLTGMYALEQIPVNMIERIETIRGGGSTLYGSSAIGGVVNIITKTPRSNTLEFSYTNQIINKTTNDQIFNLNSSVVSKNKSHGVSFFLNKRDREYYDDNGDNFSELPSIENISLGTNFFFLPNENQKIESSISFIDEFRYGGEMISGPPHLNQQAEERNHKFLMGTLDYQINFNDGNSSIISYLATQLTNRSHYTGIFPDEEDEINTHLNNPPYGTSTAKTFQVGIQFNHKFNNFFNGANIITLGSEILEDKVLDEISSYNYKIDQTSKSIGFFLQSDWEISPEINLLSGVRVDKNNFLDNLIVSPRISTLYKPISNLQFRANWSTGFRAPQAFDTDLHIAFAGGGVSRVSLSENLREERSISLSASINYDYPTENFIYGFTAEGFYTKLNNAFLLTSIGEDDFGERFEKQNGTNAIVKGLTFELRANYKKKIQLDGGFNIQSSRYKNAVKYIEGLNPVRDFLRTPNTYGFANLNFTPNSSLNGNVNLIYTGPMKLAHFSGAPEQQFDEIVNSRSFYEMSFKLSYKFKEIIKKSSFEMFTGMKNIFNAFQKDFDSGKNRDSNYVYGPANPRTIFVGFRINIL